MPRGGRPFCRLVFVDCCPLGKNRELYLSLFGCGGPIKFESTIFPSAKLRFSQILAKHTNFVQLGPKLNTKIALSPQPITHPPTQLTHQPPPGAFQRGLGIVEG